MSEQKCVLCKQGWGKHFGVPSSMLNACPDGDGWHPTNRFTAAAYCCAERQEMGPGHCTCLPCPQCGGETEQDSNSYQCHKCHMLWPLPAQPTEWRELGPDEVIQEGDEFYHTSIGCWQLVWFAVGNTPRGCVAKFRRRVGQAQAQPARIKCLHGLSVAACHACHTELMELRTQAGQFGQCGVEGHALSKGDEAREPLPDGPPETRLKNTIAQPVSSPATVHSPSAQDGPRTYGVKKMVLPSNLTIQQLITMYPDIKIDIVPKGQPLKPNELSTNLDKDMPARMKKGPNDE